MCVIPIGEADPKFEKAAFEFGKVEIDIQAMELSIGTTYQHVAMPHNFQALI